MFKKQKEEKMIIGYYSKSVFITYLGVISATIGIEYAPWSATLALPL